MHAMQRECPPSSVRRFGRRHRKRGRRGVIVFNLESTRKENKINTEAVDDDAEAFISRSSDSQMGNRVLILEGQ